MKRLLWCVSRLYPPAWRARYGPEFDALIDDANLEWFDLADVLKGVAVTHASSLMNYRKAGLIGGLAGAALAATIAFSIHNRFASDATLVLHNASSLQVAQAIQKTFTRDYIIGLIHKPEFDLYRTERMSEPIETIARTMRKNIRITPLPPDDSNGQSLRISFAYPDKVMARAVLTKFLDDLQRTPLSLSPTSSFHVLESPQISEIPEYPNRLAIIALGLIAGVPIGLLALKFARRNRSATVTIGVTAETKELLDRRVAAGPYRDVNEYIREVIHAGQEEKGA